MTSPAAERLWGQSYPPSVWGGGTPAPKVKVTVGSTVADPAITAGPPAGWLAAINAKYEGDPLTAWTAGQSATVATLPVAWDAAAFVAYVAQQEAQAPKRSAKKPAAETTAAAEPTTTEAE